MLDQLRSAVNSWPAKILLCLVLLSFIAWGGQSAFQAGGDDTLMATKDRSVSASAYDLALRNEVLRLSMRIGRYLTPDEIRRLGLGQAVFRGLYDNLVLDTEAGQMKLGLSDKNIAALLGKDPLFSGADGKFDLGAFNFYLQNLRVKRDDFLDNFYVKGALRSQLVATLQEGLDAPDTFYRALALYQLQTRNVDYVELTAAAIGAGAAPEAESLANWFKANSEQFKTPEYRQISYISLSAPDIARPDSIDDAAVAAYYSTHKNSYLASPEKRSFDLIRFADKKSADSAYAAIETAIKNGREPDQAFAAYAEQPANKSEHKEAVAQADLPALLGAEVFALPRGTVSAVIDDLQGPVLVYVQQIEAARPKALAAVSAQIRQDIAQKNAAAALPDYRKKIEDARFDGISLKDIAAQYNLPLHFVTLDESGNNPQGQAVDFPQKTALLPNIFAAAENIDADPLNLNNGGYLWYNIDKIIPPRQPALNEVKAQVTAAWQQEQQQQKLDNQATELAKALNKGENFAGLARRNKLTLYHRDNLRRNPVDEKLGQAAISAIFSVVKGESGLTIGANDNSRLVFRVNAVTEPQNASRNLLSAEEQANISARSALDFLNLYIAAQALQTPVRINKTVYDRLMQAQE
ncbi:MAG: hypothetical protein DU429_01700 [Candidatus Tokpelaia sp.]|nr:MAG: hypothetical protein DU430_03330 [Candidatus Tokpelaia sp.]KAA6207768.1 MAG: hypothetical protein DU429_01700 [Candidatus Tokpelaia sp.]